MAGHGVGECVVWRAVASAALSAGRGRARQLRWVALEVHRLHEGASPSGDCGDWLTGDGAAAYLQAAEAGTLRERGRVRPSTEASMRVRASVLRTLAGHAGRPGPVPDVGAAPYRSAPTRRDTSRLLGWLSRREGAEAVRTWAAAALAADGLRVGELAALRTTDLDPELTAIGWLHRVDPGPGPAWVGDVALAAATARAVRSWLSVRDGLVASARVTHVFCTLRTGSRGGARYARGLPVTDRSLARSHAAALEAYPGPSLTLGQLAARARSG